MPVLSNPRQEQFARNLVKGMTQVAAYREAGYDNDGGNTGNSSKLANSDHIKQRVEELRQEKEDQLHGQPRIDPTARTIDETQISEAWIINQIIKTVYLAQNASQFKAAYDGIKLANAYMGYFTPDANDSPQGDGVPAKLEKGPAAVNILLQAAGEIDPEKLVDVTPDDSKSRTTKNGS